MQNNLFFLSIQDQIKLIYINLTSLKIVMKKKAMFEQNLNMTNIGLE